MATPGALWYHNGMPGLASDQTYEITIGGVTRALPIVPVSDTLSIAAFVMFGDVELTEAVALALTEHPDFPREKTSLLFCPEAKAIPLTHAMARILGIDYVIARKGVKGYMKNPLVERMRSLTTKGEQTLVLDGPDAAKLRDAGVCIVDDVVSTGGSLRALEALLERVGARCVGKATPLLEEGGYEGEDLLFLQRLPVFPKES